VLNWLDATALSTWLKESPSIWALPTVLTLHTTGMGILVGASYVLDLRLLGVGRNVPLSAYRWVFPTLAVGLFINIVTGILLFIKDPIHWGTAIPFLIKMGLVIASVATVAPMRSLVLASGAEQRDVSSNMRLLAIASILAWSGAITAGRLLAYLVT
jgi:cytochrome b subunit of formate dehydrogenase